MPSLFVELLPLIVGSALGPGQILFSVLLLRSPEKGLLKTLFFVAGMTTVRVLQGLIFGYVLLGAIATRTGMTQQSDITSTLFVLLGVFLLTTAFKQWQNGDDPEDTKPEWLETIDSLSPLKAFGIGFILVAASPNLWVFTLSAIAVIAEAQLDRVDSIIIYLIFLLLVETLVLLPILIRIMMPARSVKFLNSLSDWLTRHNHALMIGVSLVLGVYFLLHGVSRFLM